MGEKWVNMYSVVRVRVCAGAGGCECTSDLSALGVLDRVKEGRERE